MLTAGIAIAENQDKKQEPKEGFKNERVVKMRGGKYSRMFISIIHKTRNLNLNEEQKDQVNRIGKEYANSIISSENEYRFSQKDFLKLLQSGDFDPTDLKTLSKNAEVANLKAADSFVDGLSALRSTIGPENFAKLIPLTKVNRNALVKLKQEKSAGQTESKDSAKEEAETTTKSE